MPAVLSEHFIKDAEQVKRITRVISRSMNALTLVMSRLIRQAELKEQREELENHQLALEQQAAQAYMQKLVIPFVTKLKNFARKALTLYYLAVSDIAEKDRTIRSLRGSYWGAKDFADRAKEENQQLRSDLKDYGILRKFLGPAKTDELIQQAKDAEVVKRQRRSYDRGR